MRVSVSALLLLSTATAQSNAVPGLDVGLYDVINVQMYGRRGAAYPGGEAGLNIGHSMCNGGTVELPWVGTDGSGRMLQTFPKIASLLVRESDGRMVQVSGKSNLKHSRFAFNFASGPCAPCRAGSSNAWRIGCSDTYSSGFSSASNLGPTDEIDPWLGTWNPVGSYFDRGDPPVSGSQATDGIASPITNPTPLLNRMIVPETELGMAGTFYGQAHLVVIGEPVANRGNNQACRQMAFQWNGSAWTASVVGSATVGPVLTHWTGATTALGGNGADDGRFMVGCRVTGPVEGFWHYEFAVHNLDNASGGAALRIPLCAGARVRNLGFRDIDQDAGNQWGAMATASEIHFVMQGSNVLEWNTLYNFWFDSDAAPVAGMVEIDRARSGSGAPSVAVGAQVPGLLSSEYLGDGCGTKTPRLFANGVASIPNAAFELHSRGTVQATRTLVFAASSGRTPLGNGCFLYLDAARVLAGAAAVADAGGLVRWPLPIPAGLVPHDVTVQVAELVAGGPWLGTWALSNGLRLRVGGQGCR